MIISEFYNCGGVVCVELQIGTTDTVGNSATNIYTVHIYV